MAKKKRKLPEKKSNLKLIYALIAVFVIALAVYFFNTQEKPEEKLPSAGKYVRLNKPSTYEPGKVEIVEFLKFNCERCYTLDQRMPALKQKYGENLSITYKPMLWRTLSQDHGFRKSIEAHILAERFGKGEEMKDALFRAMFVEGKDLTSKSVLEDIAKSVGLGNAFVIALENGDAKREAEANIKLAESFQVDETPTIIINGNLKVTPAMTNEDMAAMAGNLDAIIASLLS